MSQTLPTKVAQIAIVVRNIEESIAKYAALFGVEPPKPMTTAPGLDVNQTYRGVPTNAQAKLAFFNLENVQIELIEPLGGDSVWQEALDKNGESVQHIAFWVEGMPKVAEFLSTQGIEMVQRGDMGDGQYAYFDAESTHGLTLELLEHKRTPFV
ncbi:MAG: VOC family protein [Fimbriimonas sp.]